MKKICIYLIILLIFPLIVHAETITYDVCDTCEYSSFWEINDDLNLIENVNDKDVIINVQSFDIDGNEIGSLKHMPKSITINGNESVWNQYVQLYAKKIVLNNIVTSSEVDVINSEEIIISNSKIKWLFIMYRNDDGTSLSKKEVNLSEVLKIDKYSLEKIEALVVGGNIIIRNMNFENSILIPFGGNIDIYNCNIKKMASAPMYGDLTVNIYNSEFEKLRYHNIASSTDENVGDLVNILQNFDLKSIQYDIYDVNANVPGFSKMRGTSNTTVYFDKELKIKIDDKINLTEYLDYYTTDKEINYTIEDETITKIENKELVGLKEGQTNITVTTDDGHVVYRFKLNVIKETIAEKIEDKTIEIPPAGIKIKVWVLVAIILLFGVVGVIIYLLIKNKKSK